jgi:hypothetical protein
MDDHGISMPSFPSYIKSAEVKKVSGEKRTDGDEQKVVTTIRNK